MRISLGALLACGLVAGWSLGGVVPAGLLEECEQRVVQRPFRLSDAQRVTEDSWLFLPQLWGDFDLQMDVELGADAEVDVLLRQVEPRLVEEVLQPFAGRFAALRISTDGDGAGWRTREQALLGPRGSGVGVEPGRVATVWIEARGRTLTANVGGKRQPSFEADDVYGMLTVLVRGGDAVVHRLEIDARPVAAAWRWSRITWLCCGLLAAALVAAAGALLTRARRFVVAGGALLGVAVALSRPVELPLLFPDLAGMVALLAAAAAAAIAVVALRGRAQTVAAVIVAAGVAALWARPAFVSATVGRAVGLPSSAEVDAVFGPDAGEQLSKALGQLVRMPGAIVPRQKRGKRAFLLGGEWLYNRGEPGEHVGLQLGALLRGAFGPGADAPSLPTVDGYSAQQWRLFDGFYQGFAPDVVVFGIGDGEDARRPADGRALSSAAALTATLRAVAEDCRARGRGLVLFLDVGAPRSMRAAARRFAGDAVPVVELTDEIPRTEVARRLFAALEPLLR